MSLLAAMVVFSIVMLLSVSIVAMLGSGGGEGLIHLAFLPFALALVSGHMV